MQNIIEQITTLANESLKKYLPHVKKEQLQDNGAIYYMNGNNGTAFDWFVNGHAPSFMSFYDDEENLGVLKILLHADGGVDIYLYDDNGKKFIKEINTNINATEEELLTFVATLFTQADKLFVFDDNIDKINFNQKLTAEQIKLFTDNEEDFKDFFE